MASHCSDLGVQPVVTAGECGDTIEMPNMADFYGIIPKLSEKQDGPEMTASLITYVRRRTRQFGPPFLFQLLY